MKNLICVFVISIALVSCKKKEAQVIDESKEPKEEVTKNVQAEEGLLKVSPKFNNYENYAGGTTSLDDLKGKYVYIDLWATWCGPCKAEIPSLQRLEKAYHGKNIAFVSISLDRVNAYEAWRTMVDKKKLSGIQLYANGDEKFARDFNVSTIPRFILINPKGNIIDANAPRPSNNKLIKLFDELNI